MFQWSMYLINTFQSVVLNSATYLKILILSIVNYRYKIESIIAVKYIESVEINFNSQVNYLLHVNLLIISRLKQRYT